MDQVKVKKGKVRRNFKWVATHLCVFTLLTSLAIAQRTTGALGGQVLDTQGAAVPNAKIRVTDQETGVVSNTVTSSAGTWNLPSLIPGKYSVTIQEQGFLTFLRRDVMVLADHENTADAQLQMGVVSEVVEVTGPAVAVDTSSSSLNNDFSSQDVQNLPNAGGARNGSPLNLAVLAPNVVAKPGGVTGVASGLSGRLGCQRDLDYADVPLAGGGLWLRHLRLHRDRPGVRDDGGL
jgi:hypothetical protein